MKSCTTVLVLLALLALVPCSRSMAQTPAGSASLAEFLESLSSGQSNAPAEVLPPSPRFLTTLCSSHADCPTGQLCCYPCGIDGCDFVCMVPERGRCPFFP